MTISLFCIMFAMIAGAMNLKADPSAAAGFTDDQDIPSWGKGAVYALKQAGVVSGSEKQPICSERLYNKS